MTRITPEKKEPLKKAPEKSDELDRKEPTESGTEDEAHDETAAIDDDKNTVPPRMFTHQWIQQTRLNMTKRGNQHDVSPPLPKIRHCTFKCRHLWKNRTQHLSGLCGMALEKCDESTSTHAIVTHIAQLLEDQSYMQWASVRAFSNTVIAKIARGRWRWADERMIERCRTNIYMRYRNNDEPTWAVPCPRFNKGRCNSQETHNVGEVIMHHICAGCAVNGYENNHTLRACKWRKGANNNQKKESADERRKYRSSKTSGRHQDGAYENPIN